MNIHRVCRLLVNGAVVCLGVWLLVKCGNSCTSCSSCSRMEEAGQALCPAAPDSVMEQAAKVDAYMARHRPAPPHDSRPWHTRFRLDEDFLRQFPDLNDVQLATARRLGVESIADRDDARRHLDRLVCIETLPGIHVERLSHSIPYLVPRAARLLDVIAQNFADSLQAKGFPLYRLIVTSALRTEHDVQRLQRVNANASDNSCHRYGTTVDIAYNSFIRVDSTSNPEEQRVWPREMKFVLAEVIDDLRQAGTCYVRYEFRQACFHITAR